MTLAIIGAGKWGRALQTAFLDAGAEASIVSRSPCDAPNLTTIDEALKSPLLVMALSVQATSGWLKERFIFSGQKILVASKGIDTQSGKFLNEIYSQHAPIENIAFLCGPGFAAEVTQKLPTALTIASTSEESAAAFMRCFPSWIKTYRTNDIIGAEIAGAYKNVIAIAAGVCDALGLGANARAALITRGLAEMTRFGLFFGAKLETFLGLAGVGDLALTATSALSRNYRVGFALGRKRSLQEVLDELGEVAEGVPTALAIAALSKKNNLHTPIANEVTKLFDGGDPLIGVTSLMIRANEKEF
ncbi:MAG: NAD(P)-dependent glycerol-3-phosphate dehydrogenase [Helicobacteraceae bacterium]|jgi:glycerol-3-phosphate dehydrogenase (NAD(P)+)|nr:NAD(P)-dependent glycerol-3-phosphate dehydrogenase [Helicobacteraceae bacterium]